MKVFINVEAFAKLAAKRNLCKRDVAEQAKIDPNTLYAILNRNQPVSPRVREKLITFFPETTWENLFRMQPQGESAGTVA